MTELILSDITVMGRGYCVIGIEEVSPGRFQSVRPMPRRGHAWLDFSNYQRGNVVLARLMPRLDVTPPHMEDHISQGLQKTGKSLAEGQLVGALKQAEVAATLGDLFGCGVASQSPAGNCWIPSGQGTRSICGCEIANLRFRIFEEPGRRTLRAQLALPSGERLESLPVVDREWARFLDRLMDQLSGQNQGHRAEIFLNREVRHEIVNSPNRFTRIGLARGMQDKKCWLMLDSLFPQPKETWLEQCRP